MLFPLWPPVAIVALLMMLTIMIILIYGDRICARVRTQTDRIAVRVPRPSLEPMMRMGASSERGGARYAPPEQQQQPHHHHFQQQQQPYHLESEPQRYSPPHHSQQQPHRYDEPPAMELQTQGTTTYGHREAEV